jgi:hypothetical protein
MTIPEAQLETWSHQGSVTQSKNTYAAVRRALEAQDAQYASRNFSIFLQGSYCNDTNIFAESDVDVVICYDGAFFHNVHELPSDHQTAFNVAFSDGTYTYSAFKDHVRAALESAFPGSVAPGKKAIKIRGNGSRRSADVVVAFGYNHYSQFTSSSDQPISNGIAFFTSSNSRIENYPKQHSENCTVKHQATNNKFKPVLRIFKNIRGKLVEDRKIPAGSAPSYFVEGLLYNVPSTLFIGSYGDMLYRILTWLHQQEDRSDFVCASEKHYLLRDGHPVCWPVADGKQFIEQAIALWNNWQ